MNRSKQDLKDEITPKWLYMSRRRFIQLAGTAGVAAALAACAPGAVTDNGSSPTSSSSNSANTDTEDELTPTEFDVITNFNNFYEFTENKEGVARLAEGFKIEPYSLEVSGLVDKPRTFSMEEILQNFTQEERIYRLRCVEGWSMVIPWKGFPLAQLLNEVAPKAEAKYVRFETVYDPKQMPGQNSPFYPWPYQEGLRLDEAMNDLAILATGLYDESLPPQDGAPLRLVVPWKYGFKSIKTIIKLELVDQQPDTMWSTIAPNEYGFYANVNPTVDHPRWSQASERRIGPNGKRMATLMFNGYEDQVASLYEGMDLRQNY